MSGIRGPRPMHPDAKARTNKVATAGELVSLPAAQRALLPVPELPSDKLWDPKTSDFWTAAWQSPMRLEWDPGDEHKLLMLAYALDQFYVVAGSSEMKLLDQSYAINKLAKTVLDLGARMGLDPFARRSLQWMLVRTERDEAERDESKERTASSRAARDGGARKRRGLEALE